MCEINLKLSLKDATTGILVTQHLTLTQAAQPLAIMFWPSHGGFTNLPAVITVQTTNEDATNTTGTMTFALP
jgi:hypothetical protein